MRHKQGISLLRCWEEKQRAMEGKEYPVLNSLEVNFADLYSLIPK